MPERLKWLEPILLALTTIVCVPKAGREVWDLLFSSPTPEIVTRGLMIIGICFLFYKNHRSHRSKRSKMTFFIVYILLLFVQLHFVVTKLYALQTNERKIRAVLAAALLQTYTGNHTAAADLISEAADRAKETRWKDASAFVAACREELAFARGTFDPKNPDFHSARDIARLAIQSRTLLTWLTLLEAEYHSKSGDRDKTETSEEEVAQHLLLEVARQNPPNEALCSLNLLLAVNARRMGRFHESRLYYEKAFALAKTNALFPLWKYHLITTNDLFLKSTYLGAVAIVSPYSELLWDIGEKQQAKQMLASWRDALTNQPEQSFPITHNLAVLQWRTRDYNAAEQSFEACSRDLKRMRFNISEYEASLYANWMGMVLEMWQTDVFKISPETFTNVFKEYKRFTDTKRASVGRDKKVAFQIRTDEAILKCIHGDGYSALADFKQIESDCGNFDGCDPYAVARYFEAYCIAGKNSRLDNKELQRLSVAAVYWWYRAGEPNRTMASHTLF